LLRRVNPTARTRLSWDRPSEQASDDAASNIPEPAHITASCAESAGCSDRTSADMIAVILSSPGSWLIPQSTIVANAAWRQGFENTTVIYEFS
jgi:hypothetical protein